MGVGGPAYEIASYANEIRESLISDVQAAFLNDEEALASIEKVNNLHDENARKFHVPVMAQMLRERSPIRTEDTIATILSEDPKTIALVMSVLSEETQVLVRREALEMMKQALERGDIDTDIEEKISALEGGSN